MSFAQTKESPFTSIWPDADPRYLRDDLPPPPALPREVVMGPAWSAWITRAAAAKAAPADYVLVGLLTAAGSLIGNSRWVQAWDGWSEPPIMWAMVIGAPSANKSPGLDAILSPLARIQRRMRDVAQTALSDWNETAELARLAESTWKEAAKAALKEGNNVPARPDAANPGPEPALPLLAVNDSTVERLAVILAHQPRGLLMARDELAGWLQGMTRYSGGGSDRPFWLEAYGGRSYNVERMGRPPVQVDRLSIGVIGSIQPDRLKSLLFRSDDDGLLARFVPIWPGPVPIERPSAGPDDGFLERALERLLSLEMITDEHGVRRPWFVPLSEEAKVLLDDFRVATRAWEMECEGLLLSFIGKLPGLTLRLSLVLALLDWAAGTGEEPHEVTQGHFGRAAHLVETYVLPMARRAYADASVPKVERAARRLVSVIQQKDWLRFSTRDVLRLDLSGLACSAELDPVLAALEDGDVICAVGQPTGRKGGRPPRLYDVNPALFGRPA